MKEKRTSLPTTRNVVAVVPLWTCDQTRETTEASQDVGGRGGQACRDQSINIPGQAQLTIPGSEGGDGNWELTCLTFPHCQLRMAFNAHVSDCHLPATREIKHLSGSHTQRLGDEEKHAVRSQDPGE